MTDNGYALLTREPAGGLDRVAYLLRLMRMHRQVVKYEPGLILTVISNYQGSGVFFCHDVNIHHMVPNCGARIRPRAGHISHRIGSLDASDQQEHDHDDQGDAHQPARAVAPAAAMTPGRDDPDQDQDQDD
jgi:hypothetical protein